MKDYSKLIAKLEDILKLKLYLVGGSVRDLFLEKAPTDFDFATSKNPEIIEQSIIQAGFKPHSIGKKFGTVGFNYIFESQKFQIDITTFRKEFYINNNRKPEVSFSSTLEEDLSRRDFTINSLALDSQSNLFDLFGGYHDLQNKIIKCIGKAEIKFSQDPLRMLRAIRFATQLQFIIEAETWQAITQNFQKIITVSKERWVQEIDKILSLDEVERGLDLLMNSNLLGIIIPELTKQKDFNQNSPYHDFNLWRHTKIVVKNVPKTELDLRWAALLHDIAKPITKVYKPNKDYANYLMHDLVGADLAQSVCKRLKFSNKRTNFIVQTIKTHLDEDCVLRIYDNQSKKFLENYQKPQVVIIGGGETFDTYDQYLYWLKIEKIYVSKSKPQYFWTSNLSKDLDAEFEVIKFEMPNKLNAKFGEWEIQFKKWMSLVDSKRPLIFIGWSLGATFLLKYLSKAKLKKDSNYQNFISQLHLIASPYTKDVGDFYPGENFKYLTEQCKEIIFYHSKDDQIVSFDDAKKYLENPGLSQAKLISFEDKGHFLVPKIPELIENITSFKF